MLSKYSQLYFIFSLIIFLIKLDNSSGKKAKVVVPKLDKKYLHQLDKPKNFDKIKKLAKEQGAEDDLDEVAEEPSTTRGGSSISDHKWQSYEMMIQIDKEYTPEQKEIIEAGIYELKNAMECFNFVLVDSKAEVPEGVDYLFIKRDEDDGCHSKLGRRGGRQESVISDTCKRLYGTTIHEIMHVLGFFHEHVRPDRDKYIKIDWDNEKLRDDENKRHQYQVRENQTSFVSEYDYGSIMHYKFNSFMQPIREIPEDVTPGQRAELSKSDIIRLHSMYPCDNKKG